ncbi:pyridoxamine 5'-phosphate oxidase family protein [Caulobacter sp. B11]|uniref:pyridoxamine 5'-phosphate oxidase family protein n=1 Tax=Caulobacter sp. B11 TaxID=2048899 RepID=UPI001F3BE402|nr:pyridoxamine 5'-phosphate oxidase family protein [Caulobacter sp. B11]
MTHEAELVAKFWKALKSDRTVMVGLPDVDSGRSQPMTAQIEGDEGGPIWFFSSSETDLVGAVGAGVAADLHFVGKGHDLFATVSGRMTVNTDRPWSSACGTPSWPPGTRARTIPSFACCASSRPTADLAPMKTACSPA